MICTSLPQDREVPVFYASGQRAGSLTVRPTRSGAMQRNSAFGAEWFWLFHSLSYRTDRIGD